jgi:hypothetical protein
MRHFDLSGTLATKYLKIALAAWSSGIASTCHEEDWTYGS